MWNSHKTLCLLLMSLTLLVLPGCWSAHELTDEFIMLAVSLDKSEQGIRVTLQSIRPELSGAEQTSQNKKPNSDSNQKSFFLLAYEGKSFQEALAGIDSVSPRFIYGGHTQVIFIGEALAQEGILPYLDYFARSHWSQDSTWLVIAKQGTGQALLTASNILVKYPSMWLSEMIRKNEVHIPTLYEFLLKYHGDSSSQVLTSAKVSHNEEAPSDFQIDQLNLQSCSVFRGDKLESYLSEADGETFDWLDHGFHGVQFSLSPAGEHATPGVGTVLQGSPATFSLTQAESGELKVRLNVKVEFSVVEADYRSLTSDSDISLLEDDISQALSQRIHSLIARLQEQKTDVFDIAEKVHEHKPALWRTLAASWPDTFAQLPVEIKVTSHFRHSSVVNKNPGLRR